MNKILMIIFFILNINFIFSDTRTFYYDETWNLTMSKENASYYREIESNKEIDGYSYSNYYIDGNIESYGKMAKFNDTRTLNGEITKYHENGEVSEISNYLFGKKVGESFLFYDTGSIKSKTNYKNDLKNDYVMKNWKRGNILFAKNN